MDEEVGWAPGLTVLDDVAPAAWVRDALTAATSGFSPGATVASMVPAVFPAYARVLPPTYDDEADGGRHRWSAIAAARGVRLSATTRFDELVDGSDRWGRPGDGVLDAVQTAALVRVLGAFTTTAQHAYFCVWDGYGDEQSEAWRRRVARVRVPYRDYDLLRGPVAAAALLPDPLPWRCANLWWPEDRAWLVATEIDGYLTYVGGEQDVVDTLLADPELDVVAVLPSTLLDPSYG